MLARDVQVWRSRGGVTLLVWPAHGETPVEVVLPPEVAGMLVERLNGTRHLHNRISDGPAA